MFKYGVYYQKDFRVIRLYSDSQPKRSSIILTKSLLFSVYVLSFFFPILSTPCEHVFGKSQKHLLTTTLIITITNYTFISLANSMYISFLLSIYHRSEQFFGPIDGFIIILPTFYMWKLWFLVHACLPFLNVWLVCCPRIWTFPVATSCFASRFLYEVFFGIVCGSKTFAHPLC